MAKNLSASYIKKLLALSKEPTKNGYKCDVVNYIYNPCDEYPSFKKTIYEDDERAVMREIRYCRLCNGTGIYEAVESHRTKKPEDKESTWVIWREGKRETLEDGVKRFSLDRLMSYC